MQDRIDSLLAAAADLYLAEEQAFASKSDQKTAMSDLNSAFDLITRLDNDAFRASVFAEMQEKGLDGDNDYWFSRMNARGDFPLDLHQYRAAKHDAIVFIPSNLELITKLVALRAEYKAATILPKVESARAALLRAEKAAARAAKDDGFRVVGFSTQFHFCLNQLGTQWLRCDWYKNGARTAFATVADEIGKCRAKWEAAGSPNMEDWTVDQVAEFYSA